MNKDINYRNPAKLDEAINVEGIRSRRRDGGGVKKSEAEHQREAVIK